jgi:hypothetical protein
MELLYGLGFFFFFGAADKIQHQKEQERKQASKYKTRAHNVDSVDGDISKYSSVFGR